MKGIIKKIDRINFGLMSPEQIREMSVVKIERPDTTMRMVIQLNLD